MSRVPVVTSPCPFQWKTAPVAGRDYCSHCERRVHNLDGMDESQRLAFLAGCSGKVCVFYTLKRKRAIPILGIGLGVATLAASAAVADDQALTPGTYCEEQFEVIVGGTDAAQKLEWIDEQEAAQPDKATLPEINEADWLPTPDDRK